MTKAALPRYEEVGLPRFMVVRHRGRLEYRPTVRPILARRGVNSWRRVLCPQ